MLHVCTFDPTRINQSTACTANPSSLLTPYPHFITWHWHLPGIQQVSALAICNEAGQLVDNLSATDLRGLGRDDIPNILEPIGKFFLTHGIMRKKTISTTLPTTLGKVLTLLVKNNVHRVWIVDADQHPIGVVSRTDICEAFIKL
jgi:CBS domain-containing protein